MTHRHTDLPPGALRLLVLVAMALRQASFRARTALRTAAPAKVCMLLRATPVQLRCLFAEQRRTKSRMAVINRAHSSARRSLRWVSLQRWRGHLYH